MALNKVGIILGEAEVDRMIRGSERLLVLDYLFLNICFRHVQKARIQSRDALADALQVSRRLLKTQVEKGATPVSRVLTVSSLFTYPHTSNY
ncbi:hypothetical protein ARMGADRAFT_1005417 [Armillaria gallica]|uniref:Uncharacterized protein n=1 Tax=Armillaria gallica TaxID=47427 RepID=A0A2H3EQD5_ARMGA|nr:hypothetical protein ARMGADRAFT_1005417 [Armillaria gallica]